MLAVLFVSLLSMPSPFEGGLLVPMPVAHSVNLATNASGTVASPSCVAEGATVRDVDALPVRGAGCGRGRGRASEQRGQGRNA
jgi:hypothetical protein